FRTFQASLWRGKLARELTWNQQVKTIQYCIADAASKMCGSGLSRRRFMPQFSSRLAKIALLTACGAAIAVGCDDSHRADKRVQETIAQSRLARLQPNGSEKAQQLLNQAAADG